MCDEAVFLTIHVQLQHAQKDFLHDNFQRYAFLNHAGLDNWKVGFYENCTFSKKKNKIEGSNAKIFRLSIKKRRTDTVESILQISLEQNILDHADVLGGDISSKLVDKFVVYE